MNAEGVEWTIVVEKLQQWGYPCPPGRLLPMAGDGSDRRFYRLFDGARRRVILVSPRKKEPVDENDAVWHIGRHLQRVGVAVPPLLHGDAGSGVFVFKDLGSVHLCDVVGNCRSRDRLRTLYHEAVGLLIRCHRRAWSGFSPSWCHDGCRYDPDFVYERELLYFRRAFLEGFLDLDGLPPEVEDDFKRLAEKAGEDRGRLVFHRDFQSRNLMVCDGSLWVIDFQGMRLGPPEYDLAALLLDPYVMLPSSLREELVTFYWLHGRGTVGSSYSQFLERFSVVALCRCLQFLAAFAFLGSVKGKPGFLPFIPMGWQRLRECLQALKGISCAGLRRYVDRLSVDERVQRRIRAAGERADLPPRP